MKLLTEEIRKKIPPLYSQENVKDPIVHVKFFTPWTNWTWYATEFDGKDIFFGWVVGLEKELGYFSLSEMESIRGPGGIGIERDMYFVPKPLSQVFAKHGEKWLMPQVRPSPTRGIRCNLLHSSITPSKKGPLYPHMSKSKAPLFPHTTRGQASSLPQTKETRQPAVIPPQTLHPWQSTLREYKDHLELLYRRAPNEFYKEKKLIGKAIQERNDGFKKILPLFTMGSLRSALNFCNSLYGSSALPSTIPPEHRHLLEWVNEPLPLEAD